MCAGEPVAMPGPAPGPMPDARVPVPVRKGWHVFLAVWALVLLAMNLDGGILMVRDAMAYGKGPAENPADRLSADLKAAAQSALFNVLVLLPATAYLAVGLRGVLPRWLRIGTWVLLLPGLACTAAGAWLILDQWLGVKQ